MALTVMKESIRLAVDNLDNVTFEFLPHERWWPTIVKKLANCLVQLPTIMILTWRNRCHPSHSWKMGIMIRIGEVAGMGQ